jgi:ketosteroid isomerase-like protein
VPPGGDPVEQYTVWSSPDGRIVCAVIPYSSSLHELTLIRDGQLASAKAFVDPVEATDEAERLRHLFLQTSDDDPERRA